MQTHHSQVALNVELATGAAPEWIELIPAGPFVQGRDGRAWRFDAQSAASVLARFEADNVPKPIDWEHATELRAQQGKEAPAAGWITHLEIREQALWGRVEWTPRAAAQIEAREYRFLSPVFFFEKVQPRRIRGLVGAGLTNIPNLHLTALNRQVLNLEDEEMLKALCALLGLDQTSTQEQINQAVTKLKNDLETAQNRAMPEGLPKLVGIDAASSPDQIVVKIEELSALAKAANKPEGNGVVDLNTFVPRADLDQAMNRATTAEEQLKSIEAKNLDADIETAVNQALAAGKIAPASTDFYLSMCRKQGGLEEFKKFAQAAPQLITDPVLPDSPKKTDGTSGLSDSDVAVCKSLGLDPEEFAKANGKDGGAK